MRPINLFIIYLLATGACYAQQHTEEIRLREQVPKIYKVQKINTSALTIDGKDNEEVWNSVPWTDSFLDIEGAHKSKPKYDTKVKMLWDDHYLYVYARLEDPHIWGNLSKHDALIYHNNAFEVFIKPYENQATYFEVQVNTLNTILDLLMNKPYRLGGQAMLHWDLKGLISAVYIDGTNNNPKDIDRSWSVEIAIPFTSIQNFSSKTKPEQGDFWRINFSRVQWQHELINGKYSRKTIDSKVLPEDYWVWSPIGIVDMHRPERWGFIQFVDKTTDPHIQRPTSYDIERFTWNIYYLQHAFKEKHKKYSNELINMAENSSSLANDLKKFDYELTLNKDATYYRIEIKDLKNKLSTSIDNNGNYSIKYDK